MTANLGALLPGALVLLDVNGPRRGSRAVVIRQVRAPLGDGVTVEVCYGPCGRDTHNVDCPNAVGLHPDELIAVPADTVMPLYACCTHLTYLGCPTGCTGHSEPCTKCAQPVKDDAGRAAARAMNAQTRP